MTQEERNQLTEISRPENKGRLSSHELLAKIVLEQQDKIRELEQTIVALMRQETSAIELMTRYTEKLDSLITKSQPILPKD